MKINKFFIGTMLTLACTMAFTACEKGGDDPFGPNPNPNPNPTSDTLTVAQAIAKQDGKEALVKGYIVGWYNNKSAKVEFSNQNAADTTLNKANVIIADAADITDATQVVCVQLTAGPVRDLVNLGTNPDNLGKRVVVKGILQAYNTLPGLKSTSYAEINGKKSTDPFTPDPEPDPSSEALTVAEVIANQDGSIKTVKGYMVGWFNTKPNPGECVFTNADAPDTTLNRANILIADLATETDPTKVVCVQLPAGAVRDLVNLGVNPENLGKELIVKGKLTKYNLLPGVKETSYAEVDGKKSTDPQSELLCYRTKDNGGISGQSLKAGDVVVLKTVIINFRGTYETSYGYFTAINGQVPEGAKTAAEAIEIAKGLQVTTDSKNPFASDSVFVTGTVTKITEGYSSQYKNVSFYIR